MTALDQARKEANAHQFGTDAWEAAMQKVRELVEQQNSNTDFGRHQSRDGDVWSV